MVSRRNFSELRKAERYPNHHPTTRRELLYACWYVWDIPVVDIYKASSAVQVLFAGPICSTTSLPRYDSLSFRDWQVRLRKLWEDIVRAYPAVFEQMLRAGKIPESRKQEVILLLKESNRWVKRPPRETYCGSS